MHKILLFFWLGRTFKMGKIALPFSKIMVKNYVLGKTIEINSKRVKYGIPYVQ